MISLPGLQSILADANPGAMEELAARAGKVTRQYFGRTISLYSPLYLSNYCDNQCIYCGFRNSLGIERKQLTPDEIEAELQKVAGFGIQNILLLTGGARRKTPPSYIKQAVKLAGKYFPSIGLEVYPMEETEYRELFISGVEGVTIYQETYNRERYKALHPSGSKGDYDYRFATPERIAKAGIRSISMGVLLGLADVAGDIMCLFDHLRWLEKNYPGVEYSLSFPRVLPVPGSGFTPEAVPDALLIKLICIARLMFPRVGINLSTREQGILRDNALELGVTRISAASCTSVGGYSGAEDNTQFDVRDRRSVNKIVSMLKSKNFDPVFTDWRSIGNEPE